MARKSNKTAHVLNLLSGQDTGEETEKEAGSPAAKPEPEAAAKPGTEAASQAAPSGTSAPATPQPEVPANISIIDNGTPEEDPVAERIREELLKNLDPEESEIPEPEPAPQEPKTAVPEPAPEEAKEPELKPQETETPAKAEASAQENTVPEKAAVPVQESTVPEKPAAPAPENIVPEKTEAPVQETEPEILELREEPPAKAEPPKEPEPDYVMVNVMQRIVEDKIIYFMKQFEVCTCHRCKADTIALTLTGLPAKYMVMDKHAVDPMISYLTSRLISQVTVEALKACTQVKDHPRH